MLYAALVAGMDLYIWRMAEPEGAGFGFLIYGIPWSVAGIFTNCFGLKESYCLPLVLILNTATVYIFALAIVHSASVDRRRLLTGPQGGEPAGGRPRHLHHSRSMLGAFAAQGTSVQ